MRTQVVKMHRDPPTIENFESGPFKITHPLSIPYYFIENAYLKKTIIIPNILVFIYLFINVWAILLARLKTLLYLIILQDMSTRLFYANFSY